MPLYVDRNKWRIIMKRMFLVITLALFNASFALCDEVDETLQNSASHEVKNSTRLLIQNGVSGDEAIKLTRLMIKEQFMQEYILRAHEILMKAKHEGIPHEPVMNKVYEGVAKQVQAKNIVNAMERIRSRYAFANEQAREMTQEQKQVIVLRDMISDSSAAGISNEDIGHIKFEFQERAKQMERVQADELVMESFKTARLMARLGVPSEDAKEVICQAIKHRYTAWDMITLRNRFKTQYGNSDPESLAREYNRQIRRGTDAEALNTGVKNQFGHDNPGNFGVGNNTGGAGGHGGSAGQGGSGGQRGGRRR